MIKAIDIIPGITLYVKPIKATGHNRRHDERETVLEILSEVMGSGTQLCHHNDGSPYIMDRQIDISISHCRELAGVAVSSRGKVGVDLESASRAQQLWRIAPRYLSPEEIAYWSRDSHNLLRAWTLKEGAFKAAGLPLADLRAIRLGPHGQENGGIVAVEDREVCLLWEGWCAEGVWGSVLGTVCEVASVTQSGDDV